MDPLYSERSISPIIELSRQEQYAATSNLPYRSMVDYYRTVMSAIQKSPYYIELDEGNMHFERYSDKYTKEKDNTKLSAFYSNDMLSKYIPTGRDLVPLAR